MVRAISLALALFVSLAPPLGAADAFFSVIDDLPLMSGLSENENAAVTFETANGRIVEAAARGGVAPAKVRAFYAQVLPQLGWTLKGDGLYGREDEVLRMSIEPDGDGGAVVAFSLSPAGR
jgi:hypothetical protein